MSGYFARVLAQVAVAGVGIFTKAFMQAVARAQAGGGGGGAAGAAGAAARSAWSGARMPLDQARGILNVEKGAYDAAAVEEQFARYFSSNDPDAGGSFYIQSKVHSAREALLDELKEAAKRGQKKDDPLK
jgi:import inner membrane translocase subunit TIM16